jgi:(p)ppGpp synthase/HD superfamily hydrolase
MSNLQKAIVIAAKYHRNQKDSEGTPRIIHTLNVMFRMKTETQMIVGVLHDLVEDTGYTLKRLNEDGFSNEIVSAIDCITHRENEDYESYIERVKKDPIALRVKLGDLTHNMDIKRMNNLSEEQMVKYIKKYKYNWEKLKTIKLDTLQNQNDTDLELDIKLNFSSIHKKICKKIKRVIKVNNVEKAISIAIKAHENQKDKGGMPYILHPLHVMLQMETESEKIVGVLHDVIEGTEYNLDFLKNKGFSSEVVDAIECLTIKENEDYFKYINRVASNAISTKVKIKELEHNMDLKRFSTLTEKDMLRIIKMYKPAWDKLKKLE